jgi:hypothetical protein
MKSRRLALMLVAPVAALAVVAVSITGAAAATHGACVLKGTASFSPGLTATAKSESYTFSGTFSNCKGVAGITSGTVSASGAGSLGCGNGSSTGGATINWNNGTASAISFTTKSAAAGTVVQGTFTSGTFAGMKGKSVIAFSTTTPQKCALGGLSTASFQGPSEIGT